MTEERQIHVFRTNINDAESRELLREIFDSSEQVLDWSVDFEDVDKVLRVVCTGGMAKEYIEKVRVKGFFCEELE